MPNKAAAKKALRQSQKRAAANTAVKRVIKFLTKQYKEAKANDIDPKEIEKMAKEIQKKIDKAAKKNIIKKNTAARTKSRLFSQKKTK